jgi:hypothetical protein
MARTTTTLGGRDDFTQYVPINASGDPTSRYRVGARRMAARLNPWFYGSCTGTFNTSSLHAVAETTRLDPNAPPPFSQETSISYSTPGTAQLLVHDHLSGKVLYTQNIEVGAHTNTVRLPMLPAGMYHYSLVSTGRRGRTAAA